jgi:hypothetical protein
MHELCRAVLRYQHAERFVIPQALLTQVKQPHRGGEQGQTGSGQQVCVSTWLPQV